MRVEAPVAGAKGLMQRVDAKIRATLPRQARVTRTEGTSVWVKFLGDGANDPESKFPSTVAGVPPDTMGWVITLGGRKGLFVATGIAEFPPSPHDHDGRYYTEAEVDAMLASERPKTLMNHGLHSITGSSAGSYVLTSVSGTFNGLVPGRTYEVSGYARIRTTGASTRAFRPSFRAVGATTSAVPSTEFHSVITSGVWVASSAAVSVQASAGGTITVSPAFIWQSGTVTADAGGITATVYPR